MTTMTFHHSRVRACLGLLGLLAGLPCAAQYKVVAPDGSVTYTDRPAANASNKVTDLRRAPSSTIDSSSVGLPLELRQVASRFPVMLFTAASCPSCDQGKALLAQRGVPYTEQLVTTEDEAQALERKLGWRTVPSLTVGTQGLRGWSSAEWTSYLDLAGYPRESRLPKNWSSPAARAAAAAATSAPGASTNAAALPSVPETRTETRTDASTETRIEPVTRAKPSSKIRF